MRGLSSLNRCERGFTLLELLVVVLVVGLLAAIALPVFLGQQNKGKDASAKSDARNLAGAVEACGKGEDDYTYCDTQAELGSEAGGLSWGTGPGQVRVLAATSTEFAVEAVSRGQSGGSNNHFTLARVAGGSLSRTCTGSQGCSSGSW